MSISARDGRIVFSFGLVITLVCSTTWASPITPDQAATAAQTFAYSQQLRWENSPKFAPAHVASEKGYKEFNIDSVVPIMNAEALVLCYVVTLTPEGYIITSADSSMEPILGHSFRGSFPFDDGPNNALLDLITSDAAWRLELIHKLEDTKKQSIVEEKTAKWTSYLDAEPALVSALYSKERYPANESGWLDFPSWSQNHPYNQFCPYINSTNRAAVGCVATGLAQILYYWERGFARFDESDDSYETKSLGIAIPEESTTYEFPSFEQLNADLATLQYDGSAREQAVLSFAAGIKIGMDYNSESGAWVSDAARALTNDFGFASAEIVEWPLGVWNNEIRLRVIDNMKRGWPVLLGIYKGINPWGGVGHAVVVEGYDSSTDQFLINPGGGGNTGGGIPETWYNLPEFPNEFGTIRYDVIRQMALDISTDIPWKNAATGDVRNTRRNPYWGPETDTVRWRINVGDHVAAARIQHVVVGSGGEILLFCTEDSGGGEIFVYSPEGNLEQRIDISISSVIDITEPIQYEVNGLSRYFFGAGHAIYRLDENRGALTKIIDNNSIVGGDGDEEFAFPMQVDEVGSIFGVTLRSIWMVSQDGERLSRWIAPAGSFISSGIAIDDERNRLYVKYRDPSTREGFLDCRSSTDVDDGVWPTPLTVAGTPAASYMGGEPTIDVDGTVYCHMNNCIRAINLDGSEKWSHCLSLSEKSGERIVDGFVSLGVSNTVVVGGLSFTSSSADGWLRALNTDTGNAAWEHSMPWPEYPHQAGYAFSAPVVLEGNNMLYSRFWTADPPMSTLYALRDSGDAVETVWSFDDARWVAPTSTGTALLFGPGNQEVTAVGQGLNPATSGMGFTNNRSPSVPSMPYPVSGAMDASSEVQLSWAPSSDPDSHEVTYTLSFGDPSLGEGAIGPIASNLTEPNYLLSELEPGHTYLWRVEATDGQSSSLGTTWVFTTEGGLVGDANNDRTVTIGDVIIIRRDLVGLDSPLLVNREAADVNNNDGLDIGDVILIRRYLVGLDEVIGG